MIRATNQLTEKERKEAKALIASCQAHDQTFREPYLSNMFNFDPNMPAFFLYYPIQYFNKTTSIKEVVF